ncbi:unnamed protein product, partial [Mesorhabditis spiculigera]
MPQRLGGCEGRAVVAPRADQGGSAALLVVGTVYLASHDIKLRPATQSQQNISKLDKYFLRHFSLRPTCPNGTVTVEQIVEEESEDAQFPPDLFTLDQRQKGAVLLHVVGLIYMFPCSPTRWRFPTTWQAPPSWRPAGQPQEFFTSVIGVFIAQNNVGIGTIVGSATFNILCVLACCTLFSTTVLQLTWWPLFRDVSIYIVALFLLVIFFLDEKITWPEALCLFCIYLFYCTFMKFNEQAERFVKVRLLGEKMEELDAGSDDLEAMKNGNTEGADGKKEYHPPGQPQELTNGDAEPWSRVGRGSFRHNPMDPRRCSIGARRQSIPILHSGSMFRNGIINLMGNTLAELPEVSQHKRHSVIDEIKSLLEEDEEKPLDMSWPEEPMKRLTYVCLAPILIPMWVTIPDVRKEGVRKWYPVTFVTSILWIAFFSYLMVWWANTIGETLQIPTEVIGLTILAAGTSIPDLITSVIVARKGLGDMAVSSSVGSNIFDVCVGLPVPWLLYFVTQPLLHPGEPDSISVSSKGLLCSVGMLFIMLVVLVLAIFVSKWQMNKIFGVLMIVSYIAFCIFSVMLETDRMHCPLNFC